MAIGFIKSLFERQLVGLDIGVSGIKAVEISGTKTPRLVAYNRLPLPWDTISPDGEIRQREVVITALTKLFSTKNFTTKKVAVGASGNSIMTKKISVPKMTTAELNHQLYWEAEQYIPFNINEVNLDFAVLGSSTQAAAATPMMDVLLVAAKKDYIHSLTSLVESAGLIPEVVDSQAFALGNVFEFNYSHLIDAANGHSTSVILDFGAGSTKVSIVEGDKTTFSRELRLCGLSCSQMLSERLGVGLEEAERVKLQEFDDDAVAGIISEFVHTLVEEISRTLDYYVSQSADRVIQGVYVCGGASRTEGLLEALEGKLTAPVQPLNPVQNIAGSGKGMNAQAIRELSYLGAVSIGLALRSAGDAK